jgi:hypothetical protein
LEICELNEERKEEVYLERSEEGREEEESKRRKRGKRDEGEKVDNGKEGCLFWNIDSRRDVKWGMKAKEGRTRKR